MQLRALTLNDAEPWADLLALTFGRSSADMTQLLQWLHAAHDLIAWGAWDGVRLVAQYSSLLIALWLPHLASLACVGLSVNMAVHPDYRGRGLVKRVAQPVYAALLERGGLAGIGFSNAAGVKVDRRSKGYGYRVIGRMQSILIWLRPGPVIAPLRLTTDWPAALFDFGPPLDDCIRFAASPLLIRHRFAQHPFRRYEFGVWEEENKVCGVVVHRTIRWGALRGAALLAAYSHDLPRLLMCWACALRENGIRFGHALTTLASPTRAALKQNGLCLTLPYTRSPYYLTVKPLRDDTPPFLLDFTRWDCCGGDIL